MCSRVFLHYFDILAYSSAFGMGGNGRLPAGFEGSA